MMIDNLKISHFKWVLVIIFITTLWIPIIDMTTNILPKIENTENRELTKKPKFQFESISEFSKQYVLYFNDNFGLRNYFIKLNNLIKIYLLKISPVDNVIIGKNDWLFYREGIDSYQGIDLYSKEELNTFKNNVEKEAKWLKKKNIFFLLVIAPDKQTIYPEHLPSSIKKIYPQTKFDQIMDLFKNNPDIKILDLRKVLIANKENYSLYYKTDTHWNNYAIGLAYEEISKILHSNFPDITPLQMSDLEFTEQESKGRDLALMLTIQNKLKDTDILMSLKPSFSSKKLPSLVLFHDSFAYDTFVPPIPGKLYQLLMPHFDKITTQNDQFDYDLVEKENPTVVIHEVLERYTWRLLTVKNEPLETNNDQ